MTIEEAIAHAKEQTEIFSGTHGEFLEMAIAALEKQMPKKPIKTQDIEGFTDFYCRQCYRIVGVGNKAYKFLYCPKCGQKIDWSEVEE